MISKNALKKGAVALTLAGALAGTSLQAACAETKKSDCKPVKASIKTDYLVQSGNKFDFNKNFSNGVSEKEFSKKKGTLAERLFLGGLAGKAFENSGKYTITLSSYGKSEQDFSYCVEKADGKMAFCDANTKKLLNGLYRNGRTDVINYSVAYNGFVNEKKDVVKTDSKALKALDAKTKSDMVYLPLASNSAQISKVQFDGEDANVSTSLAIKADDMIFGAGYDIDSLAVLKNFVVAGIDRPFEGQGKLVVAYQKALAANSKEDKNGLNIGVSALDGNYANLQKLVGEKVCNDKGNCYKVTPQVLETSLTNHAIAEAVAEVYNETQTLSNGYNTKVNHILDFNETAAFYSKQPVVRVLLPVNHLIQGGKDAYMKHSLENSVENKINQNAGLEREILSTSNLRAFENGVKENAVGYILGGQK